MADHGTSNKTDKSATQIALLRGINLGKRRIGMADLKAAFVAMGFADARTLIASGNVVFSAEPADDLAARIETGLKARFGFAVPTLVRTLDELVVLRDGAPFGAEAEGEDQKLYAYFLAAFDIGRLAVPREVAGNYRIVAHTAREFFAIVHRQPSGRFGDGLDKAGKPFDPYITNRNWNTVLRLIELAQA